MSLVSIRDLSRNSLEESPEALRAAARPIAYGKREIKGLTKAEADGFAEALAE